MQEQGAAVVMLEKECTAEAVFEKLQELLKDKDNYDAMRKNLLDMAVPDSAERLCDVMQKLITKNNRR